MPADVGPQVVALEHMTVAELGCTCKPAMPRRRLTRSSVSWAKPLNQRRQPGKAAGMAIIFKLTAQRSTRNQERE